VSSPGSVGQSLLEGQSKRRRVSPRHRDSQLGKAGALDETTGRELHDDEAVRGCLVAPAAAVADGHPARCGSVCRRPTDAVERIGLARKRRRADEPRAVGREVKVKEAEAGRVLMGREQLALVILRDRGP
jgi:hypothetical protein